MTDMKKAEAKKVEPMKADVKPAHRVDNVEAEAKPAKADDRVAKLEAEMAGIKAIMARNGWTMPKAAKG